MVCFPLRRRATNFGCGPKGLWCEIGAYASFAPASCIPLVRQPRIRARPLQTRSLRVGGESVNALGRLRTSNWRLSSDGTPAHRDVIFQTSPCKGSCRPANLIDQRASQTGKQRLDMTQWKQRPRISKRTPICDPQTESARRVANPRPIFLHLRPCFHHSSLAVHLNQDISARAKQSACRADRSVRLRTLRRNIGRAARTRTSASGEAG
jgi:hypothetical protein